MANLIAKYELPQREWYENKPVVYGFNIPQVRARLEWLMGSHVVHALDRGYQSMLQEMMTEDFQMKVKKRNEERQKDEVNREKQLVLEGKMPLKDAPKGISHNPVIRINKLIENLWREKRKKLQRISSAAIFDYDYTIVRKLLELRGVQATGYGDTMCDVSCCYKIPYIRNVEDEPDPSEYIFSPRDYARLRPREQDIKDLYNRTKVDQLYRKADRILGYEPMEMDDDDLSDVEQEEEEDDDDDDEEDP